MLNKVKDKVIEKAIKSADNHFKLPQETIDALSTTLQKLFDALQGYVQSLELTDQSILHLVMVLHRYISDQSNGLSQLGMVSLCKYIAENGIKINGIDPNSINNIQKLMQHLGFNEGDIDLSTQGLLAVIRVIKSPQSDQQRFLQGLCIDSLKMLSQQSWGVFPMINEVLAKTLAPLIQKFLPEIPVKLAVHVFNGFSDKFSAYNQKQKPQKPHSWFKVIDAMVQSYCTLERFFSAEDPTQPFRRIILKKEITAFQALPWNNEESAVDQLDKIEKDFKNNLLNIDFRSEVQQILDTDQKEEADDSLKSIRAIYQGLGIGQHQSHFDACSQDFTEIFMNPSCKKDIERLMDDSNRKKEAEWSKKYGNIKETGQEILENHLEDRISQDASTRTYLQYLGNSSSKPENGKNIPPYLTQLDGFKSNLEGLNDGIKSLSLIDSEYLDEDCYIFLKSIHQVLSEMRTKIVKLQAQIKAGETPSLLYENDAQTLVNSIEEVQREVIKDLKKHFIKQDQTADIKVEALEDKAEAQSQNLEEKRETDDSHQVPLWLQGVKYKFNQCQDDYELIWKSQKEVKATELAASNTKIEAFTQVLEHFLQSYKEKAHTMETSLEALHQSITSLDHSPNLQVLDACSGPLNEVKDILSHSDFKAKKYKKGNPCLGLIRVLTQEKKRPTVQARQTTRMRKNLSEAHFATTPLDPPPKDLSNRLWECLKDGQMFGAGDAQALEQRRFGSALTELLSTQKTASLWHQDTQKEIHSLHKIFENIRKISQAWSDLETKFDHNKFLAGAQALDLKVAPLEDSSNQGIANWIDKIVIESVPKWKKAQGKVLSQSLCTQCLTHTLRQLSYQIKMASYREIPAYKDYIRADMDLKNAQSQLSDLRSQHQEVLKKIGPVEEEYSKIFKNHSKEIKVCDLAQTINLVIPNLLVCQKLSDSLLKKRQKQTRVESEIYSYLDEKNLKYLFGGQEKYVDWIKKGKLYKGFFDAFNRKFPGIKSQESWGKRLEELTSAKQHLFNRSGLQLQELREKKFNLPIAIGKLVVDVENLTTQTDDLKQQSDQAIAEYKEGIERQRVEQEKQQLQQLKEREQAKKRIEQQQKEQQQKQQEEQSEKQQKEQNLQKQHKAQQQQALKQERQQKRKVQLIRRVLACATCSVAILITLILLPVIWPILLAYTPIQAKLGII